jgi:hypothetical protein
VMRVTGPYPLPRLMTLSDDDLERTVADSLAEAHAAAAAGDGEFAQGAASAARRCRRILEDRAVGRRRGAVHDAR